MLSALSLWADAAERNLQEYKTVYGREVAKIDAAHRGKKLADAAYLKALDRVKDSAGRRADLLTVKAAIAEKKRFQKFGNLTDETPEKQPLAIEEIQAAYRDAAAGAQAARDSRVLELSRKYVVALKKLMASQIKAERLDEASATDTEVKRIEFIMADIESRLPTKAPANRRSTAGPVKPPVRRPSATRKPGTDVALSTCTPKSVTMTELVVKSAQYDQIRPTCTYDPHRDRYLAVWEDHQWGWGAERDLFGRFVSPGGLASGKGIDISCRGAQERTHPSVVFQPALEQFLVAFAYRSEDARPKVCGVLLDAEGTVLQQDFPVSKNSDCNETPAVAYNAARKEFLVVWARSEPARGKDRPRNRDVVAQRLDAKGDPVRSPAVVAKRVGTSPLPRVVCAVGGKGGYLVVWQNETGSGTGGGTCIRARMLSGQGVLRGAPFDVSDSDGQHSHPSLAYDPAVNVFVVVWEGQTQRLGSRRCILGRRVGGDGTLIGNVFGIACGSGEKPVDCTMPSVTHETGRETYLVSWRHSSAGGTTVGYQHLSREGVPVGEGSILAATATVDSHVLVTGGSPRGSLIVWEDTRRPELKADLFVIPVRP